MPYINQRWLGGMLTNFETIAKRVAKMQEYQRMRDSGEFEAMPKKEALILGRELEKLERNLGGIRNMGRLPDAVFVLDTKKEHIAVTEANKLGIPVVAVVDTNCDPDLVQYVIPGNDDAIRASQLMCRVIADAVIEGKYIASKRRRPSPRRPRRSARPRRRRPSSPTRPQPVGRRPRRRPSATHASRPGGPPRARPTVMVAASRAPVEVDEAAPLVEAVATDAGPAAEAALAGAEAARDGARPGRGSGRRRAPPRQRSRPPPAPAEPPRPTGPSRGPGRARAAPPRPSRGRPG